MVSYHRFMEYNNRFLPINTDFTFENSNSYGWAANDAKLLEAYYGSSVGKKKYGLNCKSNDIITMKVDFDNLELKFIVNDIDYGKAFDIKPGKYRAAVGLFALIDSVTLIND